MIGLLLSRLNRGFKEAVIRGERTQMLFEELKKLRDGGRIEERLARLCADFHQEWENARQAGLLTRGQEYLRRDVEKLLERYERDLHEWSMRRESLRGESLLKGDQQEMVPDKTASPEPVTDDEHAWDHMKELFGEETAAYDTAISENGAMLEYAFNFMEAAFGDSQEMVVFITELNTGYYSVKFLQEYECERYFQYNERLLFKNREDDIKTRIDNLGI